MNDLAFIHKIGWHIATFSTHDYALRIESPSDGPSHDLVYEQIS